MNKQIQKESSSLQSIATGFRNSLLFSMLLTGYALMSCAASGDRHNPYELEIDSPQIYAASRYHGTAGQPLKFYGKFPKCTTCGYQLKIEGKFTRASDGQTEDVNISSWYSSFDDDSTLSWGGLGPYCNPFSSNCHELGVFEGTVTPVIYDGRNMHYKASEAPFNLKFEIEPSLFVSWIGPTNANCNQPNKRLLVEKPFMICVKPKGFMATSIEYSISFPGLEGTDDKYKRIVFRHDLPGANAVDKDFCFGADKTLSLPPPPNGLTAYPVAVRAQAVDASGKPYRNDFGITVRMPIDIVPLRAASVAQILPAKAASGCIAGGTIGVGLTQAVTKAETRTRSTTVAWNKNWMVSHAVTDAVSDSTTVTISDSTSTGSNDVSGLAFRIGSGTTNSSGSSYGESQANSNGTTTMNGWGGAVTVANGNGVASGTGASTTWSAASAGNFDVPVGPETNTTGTNGGGTANAGAISISNANGVQGSINGGSAQTDLFAYGSNSGTFHSMAGSVSSDFASSSGSVGIFLNTHGVATSTSHGTSHAETNSTSNGGSVGESNSDSVSSTDSTTSGLARYCLPNRFCVFYSQAMEIRYPAKILAYNLCGETSEAGEIWLTDWKWNWSVGEGNSCDPLPPTGLPEPVCKTPPCDLQ